MKNRFIYLIAVWIIAMAYITMSKNEMLNAIVTIITFVSIIAAASLLFETKLNNSEKRFLNKLETLFN